MAIKWRQTLSMLPYNLLLQETTQDLALIPADFPKQIARVPSQQVANHLSARDRLIAEFPKVFDGVLTGPACHAG